MTLFKQISLILSIVFLVIFLGTTVIGLKGTQSFIESQLDSHAQDTATSMGHSIKPYLAPLDRAKVNAMMDSIFDGGYYQKIELKLLDTGEVIERTSNKYVEGIPDWFINRVTLSIPTKSTEVMVGWKISAQLKVTCHPGYAYQQLWKQFKSLVWWFSLIVMITMVILLIVLKIVLSPLKAMEVQAGEISQRNFVTLSNIPFSREFRLVVLAMNKMSQTLSSMFKEQMEGFERAQNELLKDAVTGLGNRRLFVNELSHFLRAKSQASYGCLVVMQLHKMQDYNKTYGYDQGDDVMRRFVEMVKHEFDQQDFKYEHTLFRMSGPEFSLLVKNIVPKHLDELESHLLALQDTFTTCYEVEQLDVWSGAFHFGIDTPSHEILAQANEALLISKNAEDHVVIQQQERDSHPKYRRPEEWRGILESILEEKTVSILFAPAIKNDSVEVIHYEVLSRVFDGHDLVKPAEYLPVLERYKLFQTYDKIVLEKSVEEYLKLGNVDKPLALNWSISSLKSSEFRVWIEHFDFGPLKGNIVIEINEREILKNFELVEQWQKTFEKLGLKLGIDQFGTEASSYDYLKILKPAYVKLSGQFTQELESDQNLYLQTLMKGLEILSINLIAIWVENEREYQALKQLKIYGSQGKYINKLLNDFNDKVVMPH